LKNQWPVSSPLPFFIDLSKPNHFLQILFYNPSPPKLAITTSPQTVRTALFFRKFNDFNLSMINKK
jgi:hypothetical protein